MANGVKLDTILSEKALIFLEPIDEILLLKTFLPPPWRLWGYDPALNLGLDAVCTGLVLVTADLSLLT